MRARGRATLKLALACKAIAARFPRSGRDKQKLWFGADDFGGF